MQTKVQSVMKLRFQETGDKERVRVQMFLGVDEGHLQNAGELVFGIDEWRAFARAFSRGLRQTCFIDYAHNVMTIPMKVYVEGEWTALGLEDELEGKPDVSIWPGDNAG